jgi:hypothetical protein
VEEALPKRSLAAEETPLPLAYAVIVFLVSLIYNLADTPSNFQKKEVQD